MSVGTNKNDEIQIREINSHDFPLIEQLFGSNGACGGCWCMFWRVPKGGKIWETMVGQKNHDTFKKLVEQGQVYGLLAFQQGNPIGWCTFGPRNSFPRLIRSRSLEFTEDANPWSIVCFFIHKTWRNQGVSGKLLEAAEKAAFAHGATMIEGFPSKITENAPRLPAAFIYTGVPRMYEKAKFTLLQREPNKRPVYIKYKQE